MSHRSRCNESLSKAFGALPPPSGLEYDLFLFFWYFFAFSGLVHAHSLCQRQHGSHLDKYGIWLSQNSRFPNQTNFWLKCSEFWLVTKLYQQPEVHGPCLKDEASDFLYLLSPNPISTTNNESYVHTVASVNQKILACLWHRALLLFKYLTAINTFDTVKSVFCSFFWKEI